MSSRSCAVMFGSAMRRDGDLAGGDVTPAVATEDGTRITRVHVRVTAACERL